MCQKLVFLEQLSPGDVRYARHRRAVSHLKDAVPGLVAVSEKGVGCFWEACDNRDHVRMLQPEEKTTFVLLTTRDTHTYLPGVEKKKKKKKGQRPRPERAN